MDVNEVTLQTECTNKLKSVVKPFWCTAEDTIKQQYCCYGQRDIKHAFHIEWETSMKILLKEDTRC